MEYIFADKKQRKDSANGKVAREIKAKRSKGGVSLTNPSSPDDLNADSRKYWKSFCVGRENLKVSAFLQVLNASCTYFSQKSTGFSNSMFQEDRVKALEKEKELIKIENSKLQLALARAKAKALVYKGKVKSLKSYCKILEVNRISKLSKDFFSDEWSGTQEDFEGSGKSSDTEFQCCFSGRLDK